MLTYTSHALIYHLITRYNIFYFTDKVGSVLMAYAGEGGDGGCFIQLSEDSTITGFTVYYPNQDPKQVPKPYPW